MSLRTLLFLAIAASNTMADRPVWVADQGDGTYRNPVLYSDYSDPDVVGVDGDYYMTASSFNCSPGLPILHSKDLVNWRLVNHALPRLYDDAFQSPQHGNGVWAPSFRFHDGYYYIYWGDPDRGIYRVRAKDPLGEWEEPKLVKPAHGNIDPCPLWDDDGRVYMVQAFAHSRAGINGILSVVELNTDGSKAIDKGRIVFDGYGEHPTVEGPKFYKRDGYYYIFAPAGGVATGWQLVLRSKNVRGPYEHRTVLATGPTEVNGPHQGAWVDGPDGQPWFLHFQEVQPYGRIVHLQPMRWVDGWPVMGEDPDGDTTGQPVASWKKPVTIAGVEPHGPPESDHFDSAQLGLQWQWHADPRPEWGSLDERSGWLRLNAAARPDGYRNLWDAPYLLLQKLPAPEFQATTVVDPANLESGERAGLLMMGMAYAYAGVERADEGFRVVYRTCDDARGGRSEKEQTSTAVDDGPIELRVQMRAGGLCRFAYRTGSDDWAPLGSEFQASEGRWIGAKVGLFCDAAGEPAGSVDFDGFVVGPFE